MSNLRRIVICVPSNLLEEVDVVVSNEKASRSEFIRAALRMYLDEKRRHQMRELMRRGYVEMGEINIALAEGGPVFEAGAEAVGAERK